MMRLILSKVIAVAVVISAVSWSCNDGDNLCERVDCGQNSVCKIIDGNQICVKENLCEGEVCSNHGECEERDGEIACVCDYGYHSEGVACVEDETDEPCKEINCSGHGQCELQGDTPVCECDEGYINHWTTNCVPIPLPENCDESNWCLQNSPTTEILTDIWGNEKDNIWAVGLNGTIIHWDGKTWLEVSSGTRSHLSGIWGANSNYIWAVGGDGTTIHWDGRDWNTVESNTDWLLKCVWGASPEDIWAVGSSPYPENKGILHWNGDIWTKVNLEMELSCIWGSAKDDIWAAGWGGVVVHWDGRTWQQWFDGATDYDYYGIWGINSDDVWIVGQHFFFEVGISAHWDGECWSSHCNCYGTSPIQPFLDVWYNAPGNIWVSGYWGGIFYGDGIEWEKMYQGDFRSLHGIWGIENEVWVVGNFGTILHHRF